jgi:hypothetical protein
MTLRSLAIATVLVLAGCSLGGGTLGGRQKCWPESERRAPSVFRGILEIDAAGGRLRTNEGDVISLLPGTLRTQVGPTGMGELVRGTELVATEGDDVTLFGGAGADGRLVVCAVEEKH